MRPLTGSTDMVFTTKDSGTNLFDREFFCHFELKPPLSLSDVHHLSPQVDELIGETFAISSQLPPVSLSTSPYSSTILAKGALSDLFSIVLDFYCTTGHCLTPHHCISSPVTDETMYIKYFLLLLIQPNDGKVFQDMLMQASKYEKIIREQSEIEVDNAQEYINFKQDEKDEIQKKKKRKLNIWCHNNSVGSSPYLCKTELRLMDSFSTMDKFSLP
jgi:hypothetical protein